jgi:molecular chaperone GrpE
MAGPEEPTAGGTTTEARAAPDVEVEPDAEALAAELQDRLVRALADLDNLRKRFDREVVRERRGERARTAAAWLPVVDDLERALQHASAEEGSIVDGIRAVREQAQAVLERLGFPRFEDVGLHFDPLRHEAVSTVDAPAEPGTIVAAVRPGYGMDEEILRPASVVVARSEG